MGNEAEEKTVVAGMEVAPEKEGEEKAAPEKKEGEGAEPEKKPNHDARRWDKLMRSLGEIKGENRFLKERLAQLEQHGGQPKNGLEEPREEDFAGDDKGYLKALTAYNKRLVEAAREAPEAARSTDASKGWRAKENAAKKEYPDYEDLVYDGEPLSLPAGVIDAIVSSDVGADIRYLLSKEPELLDAIEGKTEAAAIREIGKIEARIEAEKKAKAAAKPEKEKEKAPAPIKPEKSGGGVVESDLSTAALLAKFQRMEPINKP